MLSIGEFARLVGVSVRMLRHYDSLGLLVPDRTDEFTGYRFYDVDQLARANELVALKELGFTLDQVGVLLAGELGSEQLLELLRNRRSELTEHLAEQRNRLRALDAKISLIEKESTMSQHHFTETSLPELTLAQLTSTVEEMDRMGEVVGALFTRVNDEVRAAGAEHTGPGVAHYRGDPSQERMEVGVGEQLAGEVPAGLERATLEPVERALVLRFESAEIDGIQAAWQALVSEAAERGLEGYGPCREVYLATPFDADSQGWVVDLQQPVR